VINIVGGKSAGFQFLGRKSFCQLPHDGTHHLKMCQLIRTSVLHMVFESILSYIIYLCKIYVNSTVSVHYFNFASVTNPVYLPYVTYNQIAVPTLV
jgi:hypothetical protein